MRLIVKWFLYCLVIFLISLLSDINHMTIKNIAILAAVLVAVNFIIRPLLTLIALPLNIITFGIASIFANMLTLIIANNLYGKFITGFWWLMLTSVLIMCADDTIRQIRYDNRIRHKK